MVLFLLLLSKYQNRKQAEQLQLETIPFTHYRKAYFGAAGNTHEWTWNYDGSTVIDVVPICPRCHTKGVIDNFHGIGYHGDKTAANCPKCRLEGRVYSFVANQNASDVAHEIVRRINSGEYTSN